MIRRLLCYLLGHHPEEPNPAGHVLPHIWHDWFGKTHTCFRCRQVIIHQSDEWWAPPEYNR